MLDDKENKYSKLLNNKADIVEQVYQNTLKQAQAIEDTNEDLLVGLLNQRQKHIDDINNINNLIKQKYTKIQRGSIVLNIENNINKKFREIYNIDKKNIAQINIVKDNLNKNLNHINIGKKAINQGYFNEETQSQGYFIDEKIGK